MIGKKTLAEKPVTLAEALEVLEKQKKGEELGYSQRLTYDYAQKFSKLTARKAKELAEELLKLGNLRE
ncbi:MAG: DNA-directed RNA polymerase subunit F, partial [Hadesarchaea archaeon CG08_land_8_20_14_0_20_51_8]